MHNHHVPKRFRHGLSKKAYHRALAASTRQKAPGPKFKAERKRKRADPIKPTWPRSHDQHQQSRPLIVVKPLRHIAGAMLDGNPPGKHGVRSLTADQSAMLSALRNADRPTLERALAHFTA